MQEINKAFKLFDEGEYKQAEKIYLACLNGLTDEQPNLYKVALNGLGYVMLQAIKGSIKKQGNILKKY
ncbi:hypothetical protein [Planomicrobium okeanokoites]|uniref:hypothetical protein n=1 Tax=Planomicrobium okeanokoites TaxID=244 RepID=UPI0030F5463B